TGVILQGSSDLLAGVMEELPHGAGRDRERVCNRGIVHARVVAKEQRRALPGRKRSHDSEQTGVRGLAVRSRFTCAREELKSSPLDGGPALAADRRVDHDPPDPRGRLASRSERGPTHGGAREGFLDDVVRRVRVADDPICDATKSGGVLPIDPFDQLERGRLRGSTRGWPFGHLALRRLREPADGVELRRTDHVAVLAEAAVPITVYWTRSPPRIFIGESLKGVRRSSVERVSVALASSCSPCWSHRHSPGSRRPRRPCRCSAAASLRTE